jgi:RimJ/RimL family protein N-acetyltransferase
MPIRITTDRLLLREWRRGDWSGLQRTYGDAEVMSWIRAEPSPDLETTAFLVGRMHAHWWQLGYGMFATVLRQTDEMIGRVGLMRHPDWHVDEYKVEVGWTLQRSAWGHGYATEAAKASLAFGFETLGLERIFSMTDPTNGRSRAVMERCGLTYQGEIEFHGNNEVYYAMTRSQWPPAGMEMPAIRIEDMPAEG